MITCFIGCLRCLGVERRSAGSLTHPQLTQTPEPGWLVQCVKCKCIYFSPSLLASVAFHFFLLSPSQFSLSPGSFLALSLHSMTDEWSPRYRIGANLLRDPRVSKQLICLASRMQSWQRICLCQVNFASWVSIRLYWMRRKHLTLRMLNSQVLAKNQTLPGPLLSLLFFLCSIKRQPATALSLARAFDLFFPWPSCILNMQRCLIIYAECNDEFVVSIA